ncbi:MAG: glutamate-1-semialdehyde 2,1-aminomutase [Bdellovibrionales bacterium]|nr:glutamate-1-semialdehyde 2,1-aminomutase [Bdellovibrionales bacterium]
MIFEKSDSYRRKIHNLIPGGAHTYSKGDDQFPEVSPAAIARGKGAYVWDLDGNKYLDCSMGLTSVSLGHAYEPVLERVREELEKGVNLQRPSYIECEMAEKFLSLIPCHDMIKFAKNGSSVTTGAVKVARAFTGRKYVAFPSDHPFYSYDDWFIGATACNRGVPEENRALSLTYNSQNLDELESLFEKYPNQIAAVISEPEKNMDSLKFDLVELIKMTQKNGALFIQDEMVTGFKTDYPGSIAKYGVEPDLATWGKGIANGFSFCALTGKREVMEVAGINKPGEEKVFLVSTTHGGETHAIAAGLATMKEFEKNKVVQHSQSIGDYLIEKATSSAQKANLSEYIQISNFNWLPAFSFKGRSGEVSSPLRTLMLQEMIKGGVLFQGILSPSFSHRKEDIDFFIDVFEKALGTYAQALEKGTEGLLVGSPCKPVFRKFI